MRIPTPFRKITVAAALLVLTGCATDDAIIGPSDNSRGMIVGRFDYSDSKYIVTAITLDPRDHVSVRMGMRGERVHLYNNGTFFADDLKPGKYGVAAIFSGKMMLTLPAEQKMEVTVQPGQISYVGTYKVKIEEGKIFSRTAGTIVRTDRNPNERQLLEEVRELVKDTAWRPKIEKRIAQLKRS
ncbi:MAG: hypothetical protein ACJ8LN_13755 [Sulfurifustis sp.]